MSFPALPPKPEAILQSGQTRTSTPPARTASSSASTVPKTDLSFLAEFSEEEARDLSDDPAKLDALYWARNPLPAQYAQVLQEAEEEEDRHRRRIDTLKAGVMEKKFEAENLMLKVKDSEKEWEDVERRMYTSLKPMSAASIFAMLQSAITESQTISESMLTSFLDFGPVLDAEEVQDFLKEYRQTRKMYHLRSERLARLKEDRVSGFR